MKKRIIAAMSGGVDSSVAAALLVKEGYEVIGVTMRLGSQDSVEPDPEKPNCCSIDSVEDARRVATQLGIPHYPVNYEQIFAKEVIGYFFDGYSSGRTPNPCVICNRDLKFGRLLDLAKNVQADYIATGHYARVEYDEAHGRFLLRKGVDASKDQSYTLFALSQDQLSHMLTPLGTYTKKEVRQVAKSFGLKTANKPESQDLCFIADNDYNRYLREHIPERIKSGPIYDTSGKLLGEHRGIVFYTIGQRRGLRLSVGHPLYVVKIDAKNNALIVGREDELLKKELVVENVNFISISELKEPIRASIKIRYNDVGYEGMLYPQEDGSVKLVKVVFDKPRRAITPGQVAVFYEGDIVIGGGWIAEGD